MVSGGELKYMFSPFSLREAIKPRAVDASILKGNTIWWCSGSVYWAGMTRCTPNLFTWGPGPWLADDVKLPTLDCEIKKWLWNKKPDEVMQHYEQLVNGNMSVIARFLAKDRSSCYQQRYLVTRQIKFKHLYINI